MASLPTQGCWSPRDTLRLLEAIENNVAADDRRGFKKTQAELDWDRVAFGKFSGYTCRLRWLVISHKLRKSRTLSALVREAKRRAQRLPKTQAPKKHPDFPKRPLTAYLRFYREQRAQYSRLYPDLNNPQLSRLLSEKYKQLPEHVRQQYVRAFHEEKKLYEEKLARFKEDHPDPARRSKTCLMPARRPARGSQEPPPGKVTALQAPAATSLSGTPLQLHGGTLRLRGEPERPPMNGYHKFHQDCWASEELRHLPPRERRVEIGRRWQRVPRSLKELHERQAEELRARYRLSLDRWLKSLSPEEYASYRDAQAAMGKGKVWAALAGRFLTGGAPPAREDGPSSAGKGSWGKGEARVPPSPQGAFCLSPSGSSAENRMAPGQEDPGSDSWGSSSPAEARGPRLSSSGESSDLDWL